jgi:two-component system, NtrC family, sensor kinase
MLSPVALTDSGISHSFGALSILVTALSSAFAYVTRQGSQTLPSMVAALQRIASMVNHAADLTSVLGCALEETLLTLEAEAGAICIADSPGSYNSPMVCRGLSPGAVDLLEARSSEVVSGGAASPGEESDRRFQMENLFRSEGFEFIATYPISVSHRHIGTFYTAGRGDKTPGESDEGFISAMAELVGLAVRSAGLTEQTHKLAEDLVGLQEVNKIISQSFDREGIIRRIVAEGKRLVKTSHCHLFLLDDLQATLVRAASTQDGLPGTRELHIAVGENSLITRALLEKRTLTAEPIPDDPPSNIRLRQSMHCTAAIFAPLVTKDQAMGVLACTEESAGGEFTSDEISRAETLAHQAAIAIENARLFGVVSRSQKEWETTFDALPDCVSVHDTSGRVIRANLALARRLRTIPQAVVGKYCDEIFSPHGSGDAICRHVTSMESEGFVVYEAELPHMGGTFEISVSRWYDKNNRLAGTIHVAKDVSNEKQLQQQLIQSEKLSAIGELISGIAHELNNPLTGVMGYAQLLQSRKDLDEKVKESLQKINSLALRCQKIVQNLLSFARKQKPERKLCNVNEILERTVDLRNYELKVNNIDVEHDLDRFLPRTIADAHQLQQVFLNLITNAEQAILEHQGRGKMTLRTRVDATGTRIVIEVSDTGPGIPESHLTKVFDPFFTTKEVGKGTGLGLSLSYGIIKEHGGNIFARSRLGDGATFVVEIPVIHRLHEEPQLPFQIVPPALKFESLVRNKRMLVVDDERYILDFFVEVFRHVPMRVDTACDGGAAMEMIEQNEYDVIVTDYRMPNMDGRQLFDWIRLERPALQNKIVFVTGDTVSAETRRFFEGNAARYLAKPFKIEEVKDVIMQTLGGPAN